MRLYITICLIYIYISKALALKCYQCKYTSNSSEECRLNQTRCPLQCGSVTIYNNGNAHRNEQSCIDPALCVTDGQNQTSFNPQCCGTELCNSEEAPPLLRYVNGLICYSCDIISKDCSKIVTCSGDQHMCFSIAGNIPGLSTKGCAGDFMCGTGVLDALGSITGTGTKCCEGILCNRAQADKHTLLLLLLTLLCLILL